MDLQIVTPPIGRAIDAALVRANLRVATQAEDSLIEMFIDAAEDWVSKECNRPLLATEYRLTFDRVYPTFSLPRPPFLSFSSLSYRIGGGAEITVDTTGMTPRYQRMLPTFSIETLEGRQSEAGRMTIEWAAGFADAKSVPARIKQAVMLLASHWFRHRSAAHIEPRSSGVITDIPFGITELLRNWRVPNVNDEQMERY